MFNAQNPICIIEEQSICIIYIVHTIIYIGAKAKLQVTET